MEKKRCRQCNEEFPLEHFYKHPSNKDGRVGKCRCCLSDYHKDFYARHPEKRAANRQRCRDYYRRNREAMLEKQSTWGKANRKHITEQRRENYLKDPERHMLNGARTRARKAGIPFNLKRGDIQVPSHCPVCGVGLVRGKNGHKPNSFSVDKIIPKNGYVKGNVVVICRRCNMIKHNATPDEIIRVGMFFKQLIKP